MTLLNESFDGSEFLAGVGGTVQPFTDGDIISIGGATGPAAGRWNRTFGVYGAQQRHSLPLGAGKVGAGADGGAAADFTVEDDLARATILHGDLCDHAQCVIAHS